MSSYSDSNVLGIVLGALAAYSVVIIAIVVLLLVAFWKLYKKMGEPGVFSIIPLYNTYILYKRTWKPNYFWYQIVLAIIGSIIYGIGYRNENSILLILSILLNIVSVMMAVILYYKLSKAFGKGFGFFLGMLFLSPIFICILGFSKNIRYLGNPYLAGYGQSYGYQNQMYQQNYFQQPGFQQPQQGYQQGYQPQQGFQQQQNQWGANPQNFGQQGPQQNNQYNGF